MKSALQIRSDEDLFLKAKYQPETVIGIIKAIQLDAWKQGMTDAVEAVADLPSDRTASPNPFQACHDTIIEARDTRTSMTETTSNE